MQDRTGQPPHPTVAAWACSLLARFDGAVLRVAPPRAPTTASAAGGAALQAWCFAGAGDGRCPWWRPWALPRVEQRFAVATLVSDTEAGLAEQVDAFSRQLDGTDQLAAAGGRGAGLWLRLCVKLNDAFAWRARRPSDPWDAGHLIGGPQAWQRFQPRRATLMVVADGHLGDAALREAVRILQANSAAYRHPVRLLIVGRSIDALAWSSTPSNSVAITAIAWPSDAAARASVASASIASAKR